MTVGSGLGGYLMVAPETVYGTYAAPTRGYEAKPISFKRNKRTVQGGGLSGGRLGIRGARRTQPWKDAAGSTTVEVTDKGMGLLLAQVFGVSPSGTVTGSGYTYAYPLSDNFGKSFTAQTIVPDQTGTGRPYSFVGAKILSATFSVDLAGIMMLQVDCDFQNVVETQTAVTFAPVAALTPFHGGNFTVMKLGGSVSSGLVSGGTAASGVKSFSLKIDRPQAVERVYAGNPTHQGSMLKSEPIQNGKWSVTGSLSVDFIDKTQFADRFDSDTSTSILASLVNPTQISSGVFPTVSFHLPQVFFDGDTPTVDNEDLVNTTIPFTVTDDGTNAQVTLVQVTSDASL